MSKTKIEWTDTTWNPTTGCTKISSGCKHCYAESMTHRLQAMGVTKYCYGFDIVKTHPEALSIPFSWTKPRQVFVNSMSDLFHKDIPTDFIQEVFSVMNNCPKHIFQVLTKRSERLLKLSSKLVWSPNIWMGVTVENRKAIDRIEHLRQSCATIKFLSLEPLIEAIPELNLQNIDWVIIGGESGPKARPMEKEWVWEIRDKCNRFGVPFFFKQWGGVKKKKTGRLLDNRIWDEKPEDSGLWRSNINGGKDN